MKVSINLKHIQKVINPAFYPLLRDENRYMVLRGGAGSGKCLGKGTEVIMYDGSLKKVEDVIVGDLLMGPDNTPRTVLGITNGQGQLYKVKQNNGIDYIVNSEHILSLKKSTCQKDQGRYQDFDDVVNIKITDYILQSDRFKRYFYGYKTEQIEFIEQNIDIDPYYLGLWLGDGSSHRTTITTADSEIINYCNEYAWSLNLLVTTDKKPFNKSVSINIKKNHTFLNPLKEKFKQYNLIKNKHIPQQFISNSSKVRLELLAGLIDTDGYLHANCYEITQKNEILAKNIKYLADTLGFKTSIRQVNKKCINNGKVGVYHKVSICGDVWRIPCKIARKKCNQEDVNKNKDFRISRLEIEDIGVGKFYGFQLDKDHLFLLKDGTVSHNSYFCAQKLLFRILQDLKKPFKHRFLVLRKTLPYAKKSVFPLFRHYISEWGLKDICSINRTEGIITFIDGSEILVSGLDDPEKVKSIFGITSIWMEEATEMSVDDFRQLNLRMRGQVDTYYQMMLSFNPVSNLSWVYKEFYDKLANQERLKNTKLHFSTYKDNRYLDEAYKSELQSLEDIDYMFYKVYTLGEWGSLENLIYKQWSPVDCFPADIKEITCGLDFGYTHPTALVMLGINNEGLYVKQLIHKNKMTISTLIESMNEIIPKNSPVGRNNLNRETPIYCDSSRPDAIKQIQEAGFHVIPADRGAHSVKDGIDTIKQYKLYVTTDSDALIKEIRQYKWKEDKDKNVYDEPVKLYDDAMDAMRYAAYMTLRKRKKLMCVFANM